MLAIDQRDSLRTMLAGTGKQVHVQDADLVDFKIEVTRRVAPLASAILLDRDYGLPAAEETEIPIIMAADILHLGQGGSFKKAEVDPGITLELLTRIDAKALKMLVPWEPDKRTQAIDLTRSFLQLCRDSGLPGIVEGVVRPADVATWSDTRRNDAIVQAAVDLGSMGPDLYKAEVPSYGRRSRDEIVAVSRRITSALDCEWVVLSSGVDSADFPVAVEACLTGGASGFLAGRAVWKDALQSKDPAEFLRTDSVRRFEELTDILRRHSGMHSKGTIKA